jgi:GNAT superfamily N-acetyltransferase
MSFEIVDLATVPGLKAEWRRLFHGYATFYGRPATPEAVFEAVWSWINNPAHEMEGVLALQDGQPVGLAHFRRQPRPSFGEDMGYLDDLFVDPDLRGGGIGRKLIEHVAAVGRARGWGVIRWTTADDNYRARGLYDQLASKTSWNLYELTI